MKRNLLTCLLIVVLTLSLACMIACQTTPTYNVTINSGEHGTVSADKTTVEEGDSVTFTVTSEEGYEVSAFQVNGSAVQLTNGSYTLENVTADVTASATFSKIVVKYTVTFNYGLGEGTEATRSIEEGTALGELPTATVPEHGVLLGWYNGTIKVDSTFVVNSDVTIKASFLTVDLAVSSKSVVVGLTEGNTESTVTATAKIDGVETTDVTIALSTSNTEVATLTDEGAITVVSDGTVDVIAKYNDVEINRVEGITCRSYEGYIAISNKDGLAAIADNRSGKFYLTADIDWGGSLFATSSWEPILGTFTGILDGRGHSIKNFSHDAGWDNGIAIDVQGTIRDIAFIDAHTYNGKPSANNALFGKVTGTIENVFVDYTITATGPIDGSSGAGALASYLDKGAHIYNVVVNLNTSGDKFNERIGGIAFSANSWTGYAENVLVMTNGKALTGSVLDGLYAKEAADGVAKDVTKNSGAYLYTYNLVNDTKFAALDSSVWSIRDGAVYFHDMLALEATPEYDIIYTGGNITHNYGATLPEAEKLVVKFLHNTEVMEVIPTDKIVLSSSNEDVVKIAFDDDDEVFLEYVGAGTATCTIKINDAVTVTFTVTLEQATEWVLTNGTDVIKSWEDNMEAFEVSVGVRHYFDDLTTLPESATVTSSNTDVCTVAIVDGKIVVTPVGKGATTITVTIAEKAATVTVKLIDANNCDIIYEGGDITTTYETSGEILATVIKGSNYGEETLIPETVTLSSTDDKVAVLVWDDGVLKVKVIGEGSATLSAVCGEGKGISFKVTTTQAYIIASIGDFRTKIASNTAGKFILTADLDFDGSTVKGGSEWTGLGNFSGSIDGKGHKIANLVLGDGWNGGIFTTLTGTIKNVAFVNISSATTNSHGLVGEFSNGGLIENCYVDYVFKANGHYLDANWCAAGPICQLQGPNGVVRSTIINIRFSDDFDFANIDNIGAISGKAAAWASMCYDVKVIVNADVTLKLAYADGAGESGVQDTWTTCGQYKSLASLVESGVDSYSKDYWAIDATGITFGSNKVLTVSVE